MSLPVDLPHSKSSFTEPRVSQSVIPEPLDADSVSHYLTDFFSEYLPITDYLNMRVDQFTGDSFSLAIDLQPSINDKLTAFGGSLYCLCVMNCWGMAYLQARQRGINPNMVVSHGEIDYIAPVSDERIVARCETRIDTDWQGFFERLNERGKARVSLQSEVVSNGQQSVLFRGDYAIIGLRDE